MWSSFIRPRSTKSLPGRAGDLTCLRTAARSAAALFRVLDASVIGQPALKEALVLSLVSREHLYVEGPPGIGKTALAEAACVSQQSMH